MVTEKHIKIHDFLNKLLSIYCSLVLQVGFLQFWIILNVILINCMYNLDIFRIVNCLIGLRIILLTHLFFASLPSALSTATSYPINLGVDFVTSLHTAFKWLNTSLRIKRPMKSYVIFPWWCLSFTSYRPACGTTANSLFSGQYWSPCIF